MMKICVLLVLVSASTLGFAQKSCADGTVLRGESYLHGWHLQGDS
jgi:hypothetical protein